MFYYKFHRFVKSAAFVGSKSVLYIQYSIHCTVYLVLHCTVYSTVPGARLLLRLFFACLWMLYLLDVIGCYTIAESSLTLFQLVLQVLSLP